ncbi:MAG: hypothetical protein HPY89_00720 [Pelotomaculum sp.]|nr:hypothetical protein [Pelotomaculum sp.]
MFAMVRTKMAAVALVTAVLIFFFVPQMNALSAELLEQEQQCFCIQDLKLKFSLFLPLSLIGEGKYTLEVVHLTPETKSKITSEFTQAVKDIKLKPFPGTAPSVLLLPITLTEITKKGEIDTTACFNPRYNTIILTMRSLTGGVGSIKGVLAHEFGHWVWWNILSDDEKKEYNRITGEPGPADLALCEKYNLDPSFLIQEWFAEDFRIYAVGESEVNKSKLGASRGCSSELAKFFSRLVNDNVPSKT